ncbi:MAG: hypothetical protein IPM54_32395 [Polyangiaceae bacterium]|nr:hypothetical protein [Polyangiaceae bacterium]
MSTPARLPLLLVSIVLIAAVIVGCGKKEEEPVVLTMPSAAPTPVKATEDPAPAAEPAAAAGSAAAATDTAAVAPANPPPVETAKAAPPQPIDGCCSALTAMTKDAKVDAGTRSKATAASAICNATAALVKSGKTSRASTLTQIRATMAGKAPAACN